MSAGRPSCSTTSYTGAVSTRAQVEYPSRHRPVQVQRQLHQRENMRHVQPRQVIGHPHPQLRKLSSRADITATRFVNEYNYGDFRGSPEKLMERYFDAFLYLANWGTRRLMFRFPRALLDADVARRYCHTDAASVIETGDHVIISLYLDRDPDNYWIEAEDRLGPMVQARSDLATGDLRLLYLAWLLGAQWGGEDDEDTVDDTEPPVPAGLGDLRAPLRAI